MVLGGVSSDSQDTLSISNLGYRVGHSAAAEACGQTGHSGRVSEAGTVVDVVSAHHRPGELLENEIVLVGALGGRYGNELVPFVVRQLACYQVESLAPACLDELAVLLLDKRHG